jgi:Subtilase family
MPQKREGYTGVPRLSHRYARVVPIALLFATGFDYCPLRPSVFKMSPASELFFSAAQAGEREREGGDRGDNGGGGQRNGGDSGGDGPSRGGDNAGRGDNSGQSCCRGDDSGASPWQPANVGGAQTPSGGGVAYDANRNMLQLRLKLDSGDGRDKEGNSAHPSAPWRHGDAHGREMLRAVSREDSWEGDGKTQEHALHHFSIGDWHHAQAANALDQALAPLERRLHKFVAGSHPKATTVVSKTRLAIGVLSFSSNEVLGVNMDAASLRRAEELGFKVERPSKNQGSSEVTRLSVPPGIDAIRAQDLLETELPGKRFELNRIYRLYRAAMRDDPEQSKRLEPASPGGLATCPSDRCAGRKAIQWQDSLGACARGLRVGVIDTGIDASHPAFAGRRLHRTNFVPEDRTSAPDWHGTAVLSLLSGSPTSGTPGLIPDADFFTSSIFFSEEKGEVATDTASLLKALRWMDAEDVKLINMSFSGPRDSLVWETIEQMSGKGVLFVAAAGNEGPTAEPSYPAAYKPVIAVTAVTRNLHNYRYANRGDHIDVAAPGVDIWTAVPGAREGYHSGTSFAAPFVTSVMAVLPRDKLAAPKDEILDSLKFEDLGEHGRDPVYGRGLLLAPTACTPPNETVASAAQ